MPFAFKKDDIYSFSDYLTWPDEERWEIIDGRAYNMSPAPKIRHQRIVSLIDRKLGDTIESMGCRLFIAPVDVVLDDFNVVQPDIFVVCDKDRITEDNIQGAPDLIFEIISPSTELMDRREKKDLYERFGIKEYVIVFPEKEYIERYALVDNKYSAPEIFNWDDEFMLYAFEIKMNMWEIFERVKKAG